MWRPSSNARGVAGAGRGRGRGWKGIMVNVADNVNKDTWLLVMAGDVTIISANHNVVFR